MIKFFVSVILLLLFTVTLTAQPSSISLTAEAIVEKHIAAVGGIANHDAVWSLTREGTQNYYGNTEAIRISFEKNKLLRYDIEYNGKQGYWMVSTTEGGEYFPWENPTEVKFSDIILKGMQGNLSYHDPLIHYKQDSSRLSLVAKDTVNNRECYKIQCMSKRSGQVRAYWIDAETYMVLRMEKYYLFRNKSNDKFKALDRFDFSDYRQVGNIQLPFSEKFKTVINRSIIGVKTSQYYKIVINEPVSPSLYHINSQSQVTLQEQ